MRAHSRVALQQRGDKADSATAPALAATNASLGTSSSVPGFNGLVSHPSPSNGLVSGNATSAEAPDPTDGSTAESIAGIVSALGQVMTALEPLRLAGHGSQN